MSEWNAALYMKFGDARTQPASDLAARIPLDTPEKIIDIGCGTGNSTAVLARRFPQADILGVDCSEEMIAAAKKAHPALAFALLDAQSELSRLRTEYNVVFSNACIQWIPDHTNLLPKMFSLLRPGGVMALQVPANGSAPLYRAIEEEAASGKWAFSHAAHETNGSLLPGEYFNILSGLTDDFSIWETVYYHRMPSHSALLDWVRATRLRPYLAALSASEGAAFERAILERIVPVYPVQTNGEIIFRFRRLFLMAAKR